MPYGPIGEYRPARRATGARAHRGGRGRRAVSHTHLAGESPRRAHPSRKACPQRGRYVGRAVVEAPSRQSRLFEARGVGGGRRYSPLTNTSAVPLKLNPENGGKGSVDSAPEDSRRFLFGVPRPLYVQKGASRALGKVGRTEVAGRGGSQTLPPRALKKCLAVKRGEGTGSVNKNGGT
ncbi:Hypothetical predicted protein [Podarcis lilfordi]|uniref:Uncharacterized protein n=1 Tax=Podarcis lilfordi TaxID=74358 RepID=A0AA35K610_9SAUR|nr:Hypothetical predicted protein [Podarcis lilfordi]